MRHLDRRLEIPVVWLGSRGDDEASLLKQGVSLFLRAPYPVEQLVSTALFCL